MSRHPSIVLQKGDKYGFFKVIKKIDGPGNKYLCRCNCAERTKKIVPAKFLVNGHTISCGCAKRAAIIARNKANRIFPEGYKYIHKPVTHLYSIWTGIKTRTTNPKSKDWNNYGGRGIKLYKKWRDDFEAFHKYMKALPNCPKEIDNLIGRGLKLERTVDRYPDKDGNYRPGNLRWATFRRQRHNSHQELTYVIYKNKRIKLVKLCRKLNLDNNIVRNRIYKGWTLEQAIGINQPPRGYIQHKKLSWLNQAEAARLVGITRELLHSRIRSGWKPRKALGLTKRQFREQFID